MKWDLSLSNVVGLIEDMKGAYKALDELDDNTEFTNDMIEAVGNIRCYALGLSEMARVVLDEFIGTTTVAESWEDSERDPLSVNYKKPSPGGPRVKIKATPMKKEKK